MSKLKWLLFLLLNFQIFSYDYYKEIELSGEGKYKEFYITEDIYYKSKNDLGDIRIIDNEGKEVAYVIEREENKSDFIEKTVAQGEIVAVINKEKTTETLIKFALQNPLEDILGNRLEIIPAKNFYCEYELLGSYNGKEWKYITCGELYKTPEKEKISIDFDNSRYTYYKIVTELSRENLFNGSILKSNIMEKKECESFSLKLNYVNVEEYKESKILIETKNLPLNKITIVTDEEFKRDYVIKNSASYKEGSIFKVGKKENLTVNLEGFLKDKELTLKIKNGDSNPLKIKEIIGEYFPEKIMFKIENEKKHKLTFGDNSLDAPNYDLANFNNLIKNRDRVSVGEIKEVIIPREKKDYHIYYEFFIGIVVLVLISFTVKKISKK